MIEEIPDDDEWKNPPSMMTRTYLFPISMVTWTGMFGLTLNQQWQWKYKQR